MITLHTKVLSVTQSRFHFCSVVLSSLLTIDNKFVQTSVFSFYYWLQCNRIHFQHYHFQCMICNWILDVDYVHELYLLIWKRHFPLVYLDHSYKMYKNNWCCLLILTYLWMKLVYLAHSYSQSIASNTVKTNKLKVIILIILKLCF